MIALPEIGMVAVLLFKIMCVESAGVQTGFHPDGRSYGLFGLTEIACRDIDVPFPPKSIQDEYVAAAKYLVKMKERHDCDWLTAAGWYHGGSEERREAYIDKLMAVKPEAYPGALEVFCEAVHAEKVD